MPVLLYDDECGLCDGAVRFVLPRDKSGNIRFAALQGSFATRELSARGLTRASADTVYLLTDEGLLLSRSDAALVVMRALGGFWSPLAVVGSWLPRVLRDGIYNYVAKNRIRWFGRPQSCLAPTREQRARFILDSET